MNLTTPVEQIRLEYRSSEVQAAEFISEITDDTYALFWPLGGSDVHIKSDGQLLYSGKTYPGMLRLASPGERVAIKAFAPLCAGGLIFPGKRFRKILAAQEYHQRGRISLVDPLLRPNSRVAQLTAVITSTPGTECKHSQLFVDGLAYALIACLLNDSASSSDKGSSRNRSGLNDAEFSLCKAYAHSKLSERLNLDHWAAALGMAVPEFARRFHMRTQMAPYTWFMNWRIDHAKALLQYRRRNISEIAYEIGFSSQSHFTEAFRRRVGVSPGRWRSISLA